MTDIPRLVRAHGGLIATRELRRSGVSAAAHAAAHRDGTLVKVRKGWQGLRDADPEQMRAARVGGVTTCITAAKHWRLWIPRVDSRLHVAVAANACQLRDPDDPQLALERADVVVHWTDATRRPGSSRLIARPVDALTQLAMCLPRLDAFIIIESALERGLIDLRDRDRIIERLPVSIGFTLAGSSILSGSGLESAFVFHMRRLGIPVTQQVHVGPDRVDVLLGSSLVVELDGAAHHDALADSRRDARVGIRGKRTLRFRYEQVMFEWPTVEAAVLAAIARGDHL